MPPFMVAVTRYFWFIGAAMALYHGVRVRHRLTSQVALGNITAADADSIARKTMLLAPFPFVGLGLISLWAGYSVPFCNSLLTPHTAPEIITGLFLAAGWAATLIWIWTADVTNHLSITGSMVKGHPFPSTDSRRPGRTQLTVFLLLSAAGFLFFQAIITRQPAARQLFLCPTITATK
jgi:hypothetical protein